MKWTPSKKTLVLLCASTALTAIMAQSANAAFFALREQSAYGQGSSFAGIAAPGDALSSFFYNPAAITEFEGITLEGNLTTVLPFTDASTSVAAANTGDPVVDGTRLAAFGARPTTDNIGKEAIIPASYVSYQFNEKVWLGLAVNAPFGLGTRSDPGSLESLSSQEFSALTINFQPTVAYKFNERFSIAIGAQAQYFEVEQSTNTLGGVNAELDATDWSFGVIAGVTIKPTDKTTIGIGYRSQMDVNLEGDLTLRAGPAGVAVPNPLTGLTVSPATADLALPDIVNVGIRHDFTDKFTGLFSFAWENWSRLQEVDVNTVSAAPGVVPDVAAGFEFNLTDSFFYSVGGEYDFNDHLTLRAGVAYETSPSNDTDRSLALPDNTRLWFSTGGTFKLNDHMAADFGFTWIRVERDTPVGNSLQPASTQSGFGVAGVAPALVDAPVASGTADSNVFIFSLASRMQF